MDGDDRCVCGATLTSCRSCGDSRCLSCDPAGSDPDCDDQDERGKPWYADRVTWEFWGTLAAGAVASVIWRQSLWPALAIPVAMLALVAEIIVLTRGRGRG
jgi:hypothetical protein